MRKVEFFFCWHIIVLEMFKAIALTGATRSETQQPFQSALWGRRNPNGFREPCCTSVLQSQLPDGLQSQGLFREGFWQLILQIQPEETGSANVLFRACGVPGCLCLKCAIEFLILLLNYLSAVGLSDFLSIDLSHFEFAYQFFWNCASKKNISYIGLNAHLFLFIWLDTFLYDTTLRFYCTSFFIYDF